ncbi:hypothetical protein BEWA_001260 [Theileria equi strain WA]|uniref:Uncharacterized protein n=1 Tax=Theileria equi strain WA TaxID=1537102 RepID=L0B0Q0_THEEQ|nr:hypothetical protein BEWA_001260 [Theileria equi strain WA]AFZ80719.1 hypothetical protein BEWA_001260 [Theileria equi strain WA]|eukprot:XP_004830385.1 hypothetical protein BEWA_001260 [Theileria equi strain WA]
MGQVDGFSNFDNVGTSQSKRRRRKRNWDTPDESATLGELKAKSAEEEQKRRQKRLYIGNLPHGKLKSCIIGWKSIVVARFKGIC